MSSRDNGGYIKRFESQLVANKCCTPYTQLEHIPLKSDLFWQFTACSSTDNICCRQRIPKKAVLESGLLVLADFLLCWMLGMVADNQKRKVELLSTEICNKCVHTNLNSIDICTYIFLRIRKLENRAVQWILDESNCNIISNWIYIEF